MKNLFKGVSTVLAGALALSLTSCTPPTASTPPSESVQVASTAESFTFMWNQPLYSLNMDTSYGNATANAIVRYFTYDSLFTYDTELNKVPNTSFGTWEKVSDDPLKAKITIAETATWSDGTPVTPADYVLRWAAGCGQFNTLSDEEAAEYQDEDMSMQNLEGEQAYFNTGTYGFDLMKDFPEIDGNTITFTFSEQFADWEYYIDIAALPAHVVGMKALGSADAAAGAQGVVDAFKNKDKAAIAKIANSWNNDFNMTELPKDDSILVSSGPYVISEYAKGSSITLTQNENYKGEHAAP
ncbi:MAG: ABC transporter substrate-binding protein, partial [Propionibacteriaceae bacterium]|nr:ABC transporter substrate-binding protein [Propionibacteriaceae bacterium]